MNLPVLFGRSLGDEVPVSDALQLSVSVLQKQDARSRTSPMGNTMTAPTIPSDLQRPSAVVVVERKEYKLADR